MNYKITRPTVNSLANRYGQLRTEDPERFDLLDTLTIEAMIRFICDTPSEDARALYRSKLEALIDSRYADSQARGL